ncbi:MAG: hypothetical protein ACT6QS_02535 [Flavobacteriales bacterium]
MKKVALFIAVAGVVSLAACTKCKVCTKESSPEVRLCEKDYGSSSEYGLAVDATEAAGYTCKESI